MPLPERSPIVFPRAEFAMPSSGNASSGAARYSPRWSAALRESVRRRLAGGGRSRKRRGLVWELDSRDVCSSDFSLHCTQDADQRVHDLQSSGILPRLANDAKTHFVHSDILRSPAVIRFADSAEQAPVGAARARRSRRVRSRNLCREANGEGSGGSSGVAAELLRQPSRTDAVCRSLRLCRSQRTISRPRGRSGSGMAARQHAFDAMSPAHVHERDRTWPSLNRRPCLIFPPMERICIGFRTRPAGCSAMAWIFPPRRPG